MHNIRDIHARNGKYSVVDGQLERANMYRGRSDGPAVPCMVVKRQKKNKRGRAKGQAAKLGCRKTPVSSTNLAHPRPPLSVQCRGCFRAEI